MKRTIPLFITAAGGFVLILAFFIPVTESWGEVASVWFDILAAIAFILGGGNLMKMHLKKISDQKKGWGYSTITIIAFLAMLLAGLLKIGSTPAVKQEFFGESFVAMTVEELPNSLTFSLPGKIYKREDGERLPASVLKQISQNGDDVQFRGWMLSSQKTDLLKYEDTLEWQALVEKLYDLAQPGKTDSKAKKKNKKSTKTKNVKPKKEKKKPKITLKGKVAYYSNHKALSFKGYMTNEHERLLLELDDSAAWQEKIEALAVKARKKTVIDFKEIPERFHIDDEMGVFLLLDRANETLTLKGLLTTDLRDQLARQPFMTSKPLSREKRKLLVERLESKGDSFNEDQLKSFRAVLDGSWTLNQLREALAAAGIPAEMDKTNIELKDERDAGAKVLENKKKEGEIVTFNDAQSRILAAFIDDEKMSFGDLKTKLKEGGELTDGQEGVLDKFRKNNPTVGERNRKLYFALLKTGPVSAEQKKELLSEYQSQDSLRRSMGQLFVASHTEKYQWSGIYRHQGNPFWWMYEYGFKPLTATMFAMLAFYVASAAFRAFRAKNFEASLLLLTAFIILLGRTFAGVYLTNSLAADSELRIENISVTILQVFNTAGNRAIMIGIALGLASTSLKVLLGVDRSYLGSGEG